MKLDILIKSILLSFLFAYSTALYGQFTAHYLFNGSIADENGSADPTYIILDKAEPISKISYTSGVDDQAIHLDSASGFVLPIELTNALMASNIWSFKMRFKISDFGEGDGQRQLISLTGSGAYFSIRTTKNTDTQGRVVFQMYDLTTRVQQYAFYFNLDEWVNLTFTVDFENQNFILAGDSYYVSMNYTDFNYETFKTTGATNSIQNKKFYIGYYQYLSDKQKSPDPRYSVANSANLIIDELTVSTSSPATNVSVLENALIQMTNHLKGDITLTATEISTYTSQVLTNFKGNYLTSKTIIDAYFDAYEATHEPLFNHSNNSAPFYTTYDEFGWVIFNLQLDVFDNFVTNEHLSDVGELAFETADAFPGPVAATATRLDNQTAKINGTYSLDPGYNGVINDGAYTTSVRRGTGYYAAPGEFVTVEVPASLVGIGAEIVIGTFTQDVTNKIGTGIRRFPRPIKYFDIITTTMNVMSPVGGIIYIYVPNGSAFGPIDITISGAVKFPYYEQSATNQTDLAEFQALVASGDVLWAEVVTDYFMYTAPIAFFKRDDIAETVQMWDKMWDVYQMYNGRPSPPHRPEHLVVDKMSQWNTLAGGYPMVMDWGTAPFVADFWIDIAGSNMMNILEFDQAVKDNVATYWHEMTHHTNVPTLPEEPECIVELAFVVTQNAGWGMPLDSAMKYSERGHYTRNDAIIDWVIESNFRNNAEMTKVQRQYQQRGYSKYVDIGALYGWESLGSINKIFYDQWTAMGGQDKDPDGLKITDTEWILASCEALNMNLAPLYHFWGEQPNAAILDQVNAYPRSKEIYLRLREIRDFIPKMAEDFQPYFDDHAPKNNADPALAYNYALANWNSNHLYDSIIMQIDSVLLWYYGADFDQDGYLFYDDCDDTDASIHPVNMTADVEACNSYEFDGSSLTVSGEYSATFKSVHGCDSLVTVNLVIHPMPEVSILVNGNSITSETSDDVISYQWLDCDDNFALLDGKIEAGLMTPSSGNYALEVRNEFCTQISSCVFADLITGAEYNDENQISVYPTINGGHFIIDVPVGGNYYLVGAYSSTGQLIQESKLNEVK